MPSWSPDNDTIVFTSDSGGMSSQALLLTVRRDGSQLQELTRLGDPPGGHLGPRWSRDGRMIAFRVGRDAQSDVWIVEAAGGAPRRLAVEAPPSIPRCSPDDRPSAPAFSVDDSAVYWIGSTADGDDCLKRVLLRREAAPETVLPFVGRSVRGFSIAPDRTIVLSLSDGATDLFAIDVDSNGASAPVALTTDAGRSMLPDVGSAGRVAYEQQVVGHPITAWVMEENGANKEPLTVGLSVSAQAPQWDAEGRRLFAVVSEPGSLQSSFAWIDIATRQLITIPLPPSAIENPPHLSPGDEAIALHRTAADGVMNIWVQRLDTGALTQVTFDREAMTYPRWSRDGHWLAMVIKRGDKTHVGIVSAAGGEVQQLTHDDGQSWPHSFSPGDERIAFAGERQGVWNIYTVSRRTGEQTQLTSFDTTDGYVRYPAWSPCGKRIVFERAEKKSSLWLLKLPS
jgi:Tol biopolymer transport system component